VEEAKEEKRGVSGGEEETEKEKKEN